ncbi:hypothetical protein GOBAR_AA25924 [Gossypium barbadense]|uniref:Leucine-rich repeat-containing N-terminal plant-type domain-containing protein n=1 Tax=Gossypium barbadense TaxID=3634 RepID=A0A2P5WUI8_GOSBA|nr:hypothetical protein GOBAR_AA25924 [Gossypium barbadense]
MLLTGHVTELQLGSSNDNIASRIKKAGRIKLGALDLSNNVLSGRMSQFLCHKKHQMRLEVLNLEGNLLSGEMENLNFVANHQPGEIPPWMGERLSKWIIISLQPNRFHGHMPEQICDLSSLQNLDLSHNNLSGNIQAASTILLQWSQEKHQIARYHITLERDAAFLTV